MLLSMANRAVQLLLAIREGWSDDVQELADRIGCSPTSLRHYFRMLEHYGVLERTPLGFKETEKWSHIMAILGISLSKLASEAQEMRVRPHFGRPLRVHKCDVFVAMPFRADLTVYEDHIVPIVSQLGLEPKRGDDFFSVNTVMGDIWNGINAAKVVIADCTKKIQMSSTKSASPIRLARL